MIIRKVNDNICKVGDNEFGKYFVNSNVLYS